MLTDSENELIVMKNGDNHSLDIFSVKTHKQVLKIEKKGDYGI